VNDTTSISLFFVDKHDPILIKVVYRTSGSSDEILSVRGKTGGAFDTERTFQWTAAVQGLSVILLRKAACSNALQDVTLSGGQGSVAASLDYALDKQPAWLVDMFGLAKDGSSVARRLFRRTNPGRKSKGPVVIGLNKSLLTTLSVDIVWDGIQITNTTTVAQLLAQIEQKVGTEPLAISTEPGHDPATIPPLDLTTPRESPLFKTPFILRHAHAGFAFTRLYQHGGAMFFVVSFGRPSELPQSAVTPVRIQLNCPASSAVQWADCDCASQLEESLAVLRREKGVLIYVVPENSAAHLFSSYLTVGDSARSIFSLPDAISPAQDSSMNSTALYDAASSILRDLAINECALLTSNSSKALALRERGIVASERALGTHVTPQNIGFLFAQRGNGLVRDITVSGEIAYCMSARVATHHTRTWIIGGEDTLWEDNIYYEDLVRKFIDHIAAYLGEQSRVHIRTMLDACSLANTRQNGYGPLVFEQTLKLTWNALRQHYGEPFRVPYPIHIIDRAAETLLQIPIRVQTDGEELLWKINEAGERAVLFTQGPLDIQVLKTSQLAIAPFFDAIAHVSHKTKDTFSQLLATLKLDPQSVVVVGNNLATEIQPAVDLGIAAIHYDNPNGWASLSRTVVSPNGYRKVRSLRDLNSELRPPREESAPITSAHHAHTGNL